jgi:hypothetical protein
VEAGGGRSEALKHSELFSLQNFIMIIGINSIKEILNSSISVNDATTSSSAPSSSSVKVASSSVTIQEAITSLETNTNLFGNKFIEIPESKFESKIKIAIHLLSQLCIVDPSLLTSYYCLYSYGIQKLKSVQEKVESSKIESFQNLFIGQYFLLTMYYEYRYY